MLAALLTNSYASNGKRRRMKKFEKAVATSTLSFALAGGMLAVGANVDHVQNEDRRACYTELDGIDQGQCLVDVSQRTNPETLLELGSMLGLLGSLAAGVQAYRALAEQKNTDNNTQVN
jgi:hypothetical protein